MADAASDVLEIIGKRVSGPDGSALKPEDALADLGIDSFDFAEILFDIEERFDIDVPYNANDTAAQASWTIADVIKAVEGAVAAKTPS